jgi:hypothetical protein
MPKLERNKFPKLKDIKPEVFDTTLMKLNGIDRSDAVKRLVMARETSANQNEQAFYSELLNRMAVEQYELDETFQKPEYNPNVIQYLDEQGEDGYIELFNSYHYGNLDTDKQFKVRSLLNTSKEILESKGVNVGDLTSAKSNPAIKALTVIGNVLDVPVNIVTNAVSRGTGKEGVKIWGGKGWTDLIRQFARPEIQDILDRTKRGIPLDDEQRKILQQWKTKTGVLGFAGNVFLDPTNFIGMAVKPVTGGMKASKAFRLRSMTDDAIKNTLRQPVFELTEVLRKTGTSGKGREAMENVFKLLDDDAIDVKKATEALQNGVDYLTNIGKYDEAGEFSEAIKGMKNFADELDKARGIDNTAFRLTEQGAKKLSNLKEGIAETTGIRKLFVSEVPKRAKDIVDYPRWAIQKFLSDSDEFVQSIDGLLTDKSLLGSAQNALTKVGKSLPEAGVKKEIDKAINQVVESRRIMDAIDRGQLDILKNNKFGLRWLTEDPALRDQVLGISKKIRDINEKALISDLKAGVTEIPLGMSKGDFNSLQNLVKEYNQVYMKNPYSKKLMDIDNMIKQRVRSIKKPWSMDKALVADMKADQAYMFHMMTPEARKVVSKLSAKERKKFQKEAMDFLSANMEKVQVKPGSSATSASAIKRTLRGTISEANRLANKGKFLEGKFAGDIFETDIKKIMSMRLSRSAKSFQQGEFFKRVMKWGKEEISDLAKANPLDSFNDANNWTRLKADTPGVPRALVGQYFHKDIANAIKQMYYYHENPSALKKVSDLVRNIQGLWKSTTLSFFPTTVLRNVIGNIFNSSLSFNGQTAKNYNDYWRALRDAFAFAKGKRFSIVTKSGNVLSPQKLADEFATFGIKDNGWQKIETIMREQKDIFKTGALDKVSQGIGNVSRSVSGGMNPLAQLNQKMEDTFRMALYMFHRKGGMSAEDASKQVMKYMFDYGDLTQSEQAIRNFVPFFTWTRNNLPLQLANIASTPSKTMMRLYRTASDKQYEQDQIDERNMSAWMQGSPLVPDTAIKPQGWIWSQTGRPTYLSFENLLPNFDIMRVLRAGTQLFAKDQKFSGLLDEIIGDVSPLVKTPIELIMNRDVSFKKPIKWSKYQQKEFLGKRLDPRVVKSLQNIRLLTTMDRMGVNLFGGIGALLGQDETMTRPEKDWMRGFMAFMFTAPNDYDSTFSRGINQNTWKNDYTKEISSFKRWWRDVKTVASSNDTTPTKKDINDARARAKRIYVDALEAYQRGWMTKKQVVKTYADITKAFQELDK